MSAVRPRPGRSPRTTRNGETWEDVYARVHLQHPATTDASWLFKCDESVIFAIFEDLVNVGYTVVRRGQRSKPEFDAGMEKMRRLRGEDYTHLPFPEAFRALAAHRPLCDACAVKHGYSFAATAGCDCQCHTLRSFRNLAHRTGLGRSQLHRLMAGTIAPTAMEIEAIAAGFKKSPHYFQEYRVARLCALLAEELARNPERSVMAVRKLGLEQAI